MAHPRLLVDRSPAIIGAIDIKGWVQMKLRRWSISLGLVGSMALAGTACGKQALAAHVDELLTKGRVNEAVQELEARLPQLVKGGKHSEVDEVATVLQNRLPKLDASDASTIRRTTLSNYIESSGVRDVPWDDVCELASNAVPQRPSRSLDELLRESERRQNLAAFCQLFGIDI